MGYGRSYGMSGTAVPEWQQGLQKCKETMSCTKGRCMSYDGASNKCTCEKCSPSLIRANAQVAGNRMYLPNSMVVTPGINGLNESFLESLGSIANLAIIGLAIYGGYCLAKKI